MMLMGFGVNVKLLYMMIGVPGNRSGFWGCVLLLYIVIWSATYTLFVIEELFALDDEGNRFGLDGSPMAGDLFGPFPVLRKGEIGIGLVFEGRGEVGRWRMELPVLRAAGAQAGGIHFIAALGKERCLNLPGFSARFEAKDMAEKV